MKVLIIEDSKAWISLITAQVKKAGHEPINPGQTRSVDQALEFFHKYNPDVILLDMNYGERPNWNEDADGCLVAKMLGKKGRQKVICTSATPKDYIKILRPLGVRHFGGKMNFIACLNNACACDKG